MIFLSVFQSGYDEAQYLIPSDPRSKLQGNQMVLDKHSLRLQDFNQSLSSYEFSGARTQLSQVQAPASKHHWKNSHLEEVVKQTATLVEKNKALCVTASRVDR